ncbi:MAG TPA: hypothetical protein VFI39_09615 [Gemmatimonadales bacterium]|nr:hypothetical protein [Gemmatimonadales bacterium]
MRSALQRIYLAVGATALGITLQAGGLAAQDQRLARLDAATRAGVTVVIDSLRAGGLPTEPLIQKALEGASKGASADRIVMAVRALGRDLGLVHALLGPSATEAELVAGAAAVRGGVAGSDIAALARLQAGRGLLVPLSVLAELVARGVPVDSAAAAVTRVAQRGGGNADFNTLERGIEHDIEAGIPAGAAASVRAGVQGPPIGVPGAVNRGLRGRPARPVGRP